MKTAPKKQPDVSGYMLLLFEALQALDKYHPSHQYGTKTTIATVEGHTGHFSQYRSLPYICACLFDLCWCVCVLLRTGSKADINIPSIDHMYKISV